MNNCLAAMGMALFYAVWPAWLIAQDAALRYNAYGVPGIIDMPGASSAPDAELAFSTSTFSGQTRNTLTFQVSPRLSASFRYAVLNDISGQEGVFYDTILDRSFALQYRLSDETMHRPAVAIGVNDFVGTGIYAGEYIVATKNWNAGLSGTVGLGWGRLAGTNSFANPLGGRFAQRPERVFANGGTVTRNSFFKGDVSVFGGLHWQMNDQFGLTAEYSSDVYPYEDGVSFNRRTPVNVGLTYTPIPNLQLSAQYLYGAELGLQLSYAINPRDPPYGSGLDSGPTPVRATPFSVTDRQAALIRALEAHGLQLVAIASHGHEISIEVENYQYVGAAQAVGRAARVLAAFAPASITHFEIALVNAGIAGPRLRILREDLIAQENALDGAAQMRDRVVVSRQFDRPNPVRQPRFDWGLRPYLTPNLFDPDDPLRADFGIAVDARWMPVSGIIVAGTVQQRAIGNLDQATRMSDSILPRVRSDFALYDQEGDVDLTKLTAAWYVQPRPEITARITIGLLERMFGGVSAEVLWTPSDSDLAFGVEVNRVRQRGYDTDFEFLDYEVTTGHASVYWNMGRGYRSQLDVGRYLAADWGATLTMTRAFRNGWSIGTFATLTDVPFADFGEGSFDKGIVLTVPVNWLSGRPTRDTIDRTIRPVTRDGGARLDVDGRLYDMTRAISEEALSESWGRFWR